jgi:hypothetical protein
MCGPRGATQTAASVRAGAVAAYFTVGCREEGIGSHLHSVAGFQTLGVSMNGLL